MRPRLAPELQARVAEADTVIFHVLEAAKGIRHNESDAQIHALALYATVLELVSACVLLTKFGEPNAVPILLRSMYEALVDLDNLLHEPGYVEHIQAANYKQMIRIMKSAPLRKEFQQGQKADFDQFVSQLAELEAKGKGPLKIRDRYY